MSFPDHFSGHAESYAAHRPDYPPALADYLARVAPRSRLAWDAGCGSGQLAVPLADRFRRVVGTDASRRQLAAARPHDGVRYLCSLAEASGLASGVVDLAVSAQAAHWFEAGAYHAEVRRVARPGAAVARISYALPRVSEAVDRVLAAFQAEAVDPHWPPERRHVDGRYAELPFPFERLEAPRGLELEAAWPLERLAGYVETWSAVRELVRRRGRGPVETFRRRLERAWGDPQEARRVRWPLTVQAGRVA